MIRKFLALTCASLLAFSSLAYAQEGYVDAMTGEFYGNSQVSFREYSSFYVTIPISISPDCPGDVTVTMDHVEDGYHVSVYLTNLDENGCITVESEAGNTGKLSVMHSGGLYNVNANGYVTSFYPANYIDGASAVIDISVASFGERMKPGTYTGILGFRIACENDQ